MASSLKSVDKGAKKTVSLYAKLNKGYRVDVGIPDDGKMHGSISVYDLGLVHEFGLGVPERSFIRSYFDANKARIQAMVQRTTELIATGKMTQEKAMAALGLRMQADIQARMAKGTPPPLDPKTIARKGSSVPLIDTGQLRAAVTYILHMASGGTP